MNTKSRANFELRRRTIDRMEFIEDGKIAFTYITLQDEQDVKRLIRYAYQYAHKLWKYNH